MAMRSKATAASAIAATERSASPRTPVRHHAIRVAAAAGLDPSSPVPIDRAQNLNTPPPTEQRRPSFAGSTPEMPFGPESPVLMSMSQRAVHLGIEVTWASSPNRRSTSPLVDRHSVGGSGGGGGAGSAGSGSESPTELVRRRSLKHRQVFKAQQHHRHHHHQHQHHSGTCSKKGIYKFNEELMKLTARTKRAHNTASAALLSPESSDSAGLSRVDSAESTASSSSASAHQQQPGSPVTISFGTPVRLAAGLGDFLSTSMQNEFLDNSDLDMELLLSSQDAENQLQRQQQQKQQSTPPAPLRTPCRKSAAGSGRSNHAGGSASRVHGHSHGLGNVTLLDNDSIDEYMMSKELDAFITQSQTVPIDGSPKRTIERHKSMSFAEQSKLSTSDEELMALMDETLAGQRTPLRDTSVRNTSMNRHNSMPTVSLRKSGQRKLRPYVAPPMEQSLSIESDTDDSDDDRFHSCR